MSDIIRRHMIRYPNARPTTLAYLEKRAEKTEQLRRELLSEQEVRHQHTMLGRLMRKLGWRG